MLLNLVLLILFIIVLISDTNIIEGQEVQGSAVDTDIDAVPKKDPLFNVLNFFPRLFKNELVLYEKKHNDDRDEVYLSSLFESKGLYNGSEEKDQQKVINQSDITAQCVDGSDTIIETHINEIVDQYNNGNTNNNNNNNNNDRERSMNYLNFNLWGIDMNFDFNDTGDNVSDNDTLSIGKDSHTICELPSILYDKNVPVDKRVEISGEYGSCYDMNSDMYNKCRKSCYEATSSRNKDTTSINYCTGFLTRPDCPSRTTRDNNEYYIKKDQGYYLQCMYGDENFEPIHENIPCKPLICHGSEGICSDVNIESGDDYHKREFECNNTYYQDDQGQFQCIIGSDGCQKQGVLEQINCIPENQHPEKDYITCYKEGSKYIKTNKDDTDYIVTLF